MKPKVFEWFDEFDSEPATTGTDASAAHGAGGIGRITIDPVLHNRYNMVIEAVWGLGEGIVSGAITPDHYKVDRETYELMVDYRTRTGCFTFVSVYVKSIRSDYLGAGRDENRFCELMFYLGIDQKNMTDEILDDIVSDFDDVCLKHGGFRYMHTKTSTDERIDRLDPNRARAQQSVVAGGE